MVTVARAAVSRRMTRAGGFRRGSGDGMQARTPASTREVPAMGAKAALNWRPARAGAGSYGMAERSVVPKGRRSLPVKRVMTVEERDLS